MARSARVHSYSNVYHVMLRGVNRQQIFEEKSDYIQFIKILYELIPISQYKLYAFCLMGNHIHLLIKVEDEPLDLIMKRLENRFVHWYNKKYNRTGHLFENRYKSEPVEDEKYLIIVLRYILQNPVKAGMCNDIFEYPWSSVKYIISSKESMVSVSDFRLLFNSNNDFIQFLKASNDDQCLDYEFKYENITDEEAISIIKEKTGCSSISEFKNYDKVIRNKYIKELSPYMTIRQLAQLSGLSKSQIHRIKSQKGQGDRCD